MLRAAALTAEYSKAEASAEANNMRLLFFLFIAANFSGYAQQKPPVPQKPKLFPLKKENEWVYYSTTYEPFSDGDRKKSYPLVKRDTFYYRIADTITFGKKKYFALNNF